jgi:hypothetical protein
MKHNHWVPADALTCANSATHYWYENNMVCQLEVGEEWGRGIVRKFWHKSKI